MELLQCTASLPGGSGKGNSYNVLPQNPGAAGSGTPATYCLTAGGQWALELLQHIASLPGAVGGGTPSGMRDSNKALPHCLGVVGSGTPATHRLTARGQWAVEPLQCTTSLPRGHEQLGSCNALPHCPGALGSGTPATHCLTAWGQRAVGVCNALPHCLGAVGSGTPPIS